MSTIDKPTPSEVPQTVFDIDEAAAYLRMSSKTLEHLRLGGDGPAFIRLSPRVIRYRKSDIDAWLESRIETGRAS